MVYGMYVDDLFDVYLFLEFISDFFFRKFNCFSLDCFLKYLNLLFILY